MSKYHQFVYHDEHLYPVIKDASDDEKRMLAKILSHRTSCEIAADCTNPAAIVHEIQTMGGHSFANTYRGHGVCYQEIINDLLKYLRIEKKGDNLKEHEWAIMERTLRDMLDKLPEQERQSFEDAINAHASKTEHQGPISIQDIFDCIHAPEGLGKYQLLATVLLPVFPLALFGGAFAFWRLGMPANDTTKVCVFAIALIRARQRHEQHQTGP